MTREYTYDKIDQVDDTHVLDNDGSLKSNYRPTRYFCSHSRDILGYILVAVLVFASFFAGFLVHSVTSASNNSIRHSAHEDATKENGSTRAFLPQFSRRIESFVLNDSFHDPPSRDVTAAWESLIPKGQGAIHLPISNEYENEIYNIAVFHGMHCLARVKNRFPLEPKLIALQYTLRQSFFAFHQMATASPAISRPAHETAYMLKHGSHCIEYIRQQLMCMPDLTLEPIDLETGSPKDWGVERMCVDWNEVSEWAVKERSNDEMGIV